MFMTTYWVSVIIRDSRIIAWEQTHPLPSFSKVALLQLNRLITGCNIRVKFHSEDDVVRKQMPRLPSFVKENLKRMFS